MQTLYHYMRMVTVDTQGLFFTLKVVLVLSLFGTGWYAWEPVSTLLHAEADEQTTATALESDTHFTTDTFEFPATESLHGRYLFVDADTMRVTLYEGSTEVNSFPIEHIPQQESPDALTSGSFTIGTITDAELSTVTKVRFPHYVQFGNRYAFHGTPTDMDGTPLSREYAGNSILLSNDDARTVEEFATSGMVVYSEAPEPKKISTTDTKMVSNGELPATSASSYALQDMESGQIYLIKGGDERYPIASITKLVTAAVASDVIGHGEEVLAPNGEHYTLGDLFYPLLLRSDNEVAKRIAIHVGAEEFVAHMNAYARAHGMQSSSFADSSGLSPRDISTVNDLLTFAKHLYTNKEYLLAMTSEADMTITSTEGNKRLVVNQNKLADDPYFRGGKLGYTDEAGQTSLSIFNVPLNGKTRPVAVVVLGSQDWKQDTRTLLQWLVNTTDE